MLIGLIKIRGNKMLKRTLLKVAAISLLAVLIISGTLYIAVFKRAPNHISGRPVISQNGEELAFKVGYIGEDKKLFSAEPRPYVLKLEKDVSQVMPVRGAKRVLAMAWRPGAQPPELFMVMLPRHEPGRILAVKVSDGVSTVSFQVLPDDIIVSSLDWNPSGQILASRVSKICNGAYLGISYDNGRSMNVTDIKIRGGNLVWANDRTLYLQNGNDIFEVDVSDKKPRVTKTIVSAEGVHLAESLNEKLIYTLGNEVYWGNQLLYRSDETIGPVDADASYIVFQTGNHIVLFDEKGNLINKKEVEENTIFIGISSAHKFVYLMRNLQSIERYNFVDGDEISTVFDVGILK